MAVDFGVCILALLASNLRSLVVCCDKVFVVFSVPLDNMRALAICISVRR